MQHAFSTAPGMAAAGTIVAIALWAAPSAWAQG